MTSIDHRGVVPYSLYESERTEKERALQAIARYERRHDRLMRLAKCIRRNWREAHGRLRSVGFAFFGVSALVLLAGVVRGMAR